MVDKDKLFKKYRLIFFIEYIVIAAVLFLIGFLRLFDVIEYSSGRLLAYNIITLIGFAYIIFDLCWNLRKSKRADFSLIDKIPPVVLAVYLLVFDILVLSKAIEDLNFIKYSISGVLLYAGTYAGFMGIYHFKKPQKMLLDAVEEAYQEQLKELEEEKQKEESEGKE